MKFTLASMGMSDHQYVAAIHRDTDNLHACCCQPHQSPDI
ncbi:relaxase/mobilization nuclease domain-containing protein [Escherichia coli]|nr:relaxase/mobilization nuclease domain-containing protein [Escherichia coli]